MRKLLAALAIAGGCFAQGWTVERYKATTSASTDMSVDVTVMRFGSSAPYPWDAPGETGLVDVISVAINSKDRAMGYEVLVCYETATDTLRTVKIEAAKINATDPTYASRYIRSVKRIRSVSVRTLLAPTDFDVSPLN